MAAGCGRPLTMDEGQPFISPCRPRRRRHHLQFPERTFLSCALVVLRCFPQLTALCQGVEHPVLNSRALPAHTNVLSILIMVALFGGYGRYRSPLPPLRP